VIVRALPARILGALASGFLFAAAFPAWDLGWLAWVALVPLLLSIRGVSPAQAFGLGAIAGLVGYGWLMSWIAIFGAPAWALLSVGLASLLGAFAAAAVVLAQHYGGRGGHVWLWIVPLTWLAVEVIRSVGPLGFPWGLLGLTQHRLPMTLAAAAIGGVFGLGAVIALVNAGLAAIIAERRISRPVLAAFALVAAIVAVPYALPEHRAPAARIVAAIQPNVPPLLRGNPSISTTIMEGLLRQTAQAREAGAEIIVYPESAVPPDLSTVIGNRWAMARAADGAVVVAGAYLPGPQNGVLVVGPNGQTLGRYAKRRLVPFGEAGLRPGVDADPVSTPAGSIGLAICYESAFTELIRPLAAGHADLLAVLTNDGWFGTSAGPPQHAAHAVMRAVETGRSLVRAANTGTSMLIRPDGRVVASQPLGTAGVLAAELPVGGPVTPYVRWGWLIVPLGLAVWLAALAPLTWEAWRRRPNESLRLAAAVGVPGVVAGIMVLLREVWGVSGWWDGLPLLAAAVVVGRGHLLNRRGTLASLALSLSVTAVLVISMKAAYAGYGFTLSIGPADGSWTIWVVTHLIRGIALELWLRGAVFGRALPVGGWAAALVLSTALGVGLHAGQPQEIIFWHFFTCLAYGLIRARTGDASGLGPARGFGDAVLLGLTGLR
jgi:apolipoprotein N-acyltransferase